MPGHTNAAQASYAELNCDGKKRPLYTGTDVGFSSLCISKEITYKFIEDVVKEVSAITPGPYFHIGGDEALSTPDADYVKFMNRVLPIVKKYGKTTSGWHEFIKTTKDTALVPQFWGTTTSNADVAAAAKRGNKVLMSPANRIYLDMKYNKNTKLGLNWAGLRRGQGRLQLEPRRLPQRRDRGEHPRRRGSTVDGDHQDVVRHRADGVPASARGGGARLVDRREPQLGPVRATPGRARPAIQGPGHQLLRLDPGALEEVVALGRKARSYEQAVRTCFSLGQK